MTPEQRPAHSSSTPAAEPPPGLSPGMVAFMWCATGAGFVLGTAALAVGLVGLAQGVSVGTALAVAAFGVFFLLCALWYLPLMMTRRRALAEFASARAELPGAIDQARADWTSRSPTTNAMSTGERAGPWRSLSAAMGNNRGVTGPEHRPSPPSGSGSGDASSPVGVSPGVRALLWFVALAGLVLGLFVLFLGVAATTQGSGVAPAAIGVVVGTALFLGALYQVRLLVVNARARREFEAARADLAHASRDARADSDDRPEAD